MKPFETLITIPVDIENPKETGIYITDLGRIQYMYSSLSEKFQWKDNDGYVKSPNWWLKSVGDLEEILENAFIQSRMRKYDFDADTELDRYRTFSDYFKAFKRKYEI